MQYEEFLQKSGATMAEVSYDTYTRLIEKAYMERDDLFPTQEALIKYFEATGVVGFTNNALQKLDALRKALGEITRYFPNIAEKLVDFAARTAPRV